MNYLARKIRDGVLLLIGVSALSFLLLEIAPGNFLSEMQLNPQISPETVAALRVRYGLDRPVPVRYLRWLHSTATGDFGYSFSYNVPVADLVWPRAKNTLLLTTCASLLAWIVALPVGIGMALKRGSAAAQAASGIVSLLLAIPELTLALGALVFAAYTRIFPIGGMFSFSAENASGGAALVDLGRHLVLPASVLALGVAPMLVRHIRAAVIEVLDAGFVRAGRALGIPRRTLLFEYVLRAAANPLISLAGLSVAGLLSMSLLVEVVLSWPGLGPLLLEAIFARDIFLVIAVVMLSTAFLVCGNFLSDFALLACDPRIRRDIS